MSETTATPSAATEVSAATPAASETAAHFEKTDLSIRSLLEAGAHFGHLTRRWNPLMRPYIFGSRNGTHILDLDQTFGLFSAGLEFIRNTTAAGGNVLLVGTKRQASAIVKEEAERAGQYYVNNRWLGGMLTNWKTVKKSIDTYRSLLEILGNEEKRNAHSKKELARMTRQTDKYQKSLEGIKEMPRVPDAMFVIDVSKEDIAISEGRRLGIPIIAVVDSNCSPRGIDFVVPGNDDATRAIQLYCRCIADACIEGRAIHQEHLVSQRGSEAAAEKPRQTGGRRVVEIKQAPRRGRTTGSGRTHTSGGWADKGGSGGGGSDAGPTVVVKPSSSAAADPSDAKKS
jgi:small subunit ribosomal protein S2